MICPNHNSKEWQALVAAVGTFEAYRDWAENDYTVREPAIVQAKIDYRDNPFVPDSFEEELRNSSDEPLDKLGEDDPLISMMDPGKIDLESGEFTPNKPEGNTEIQGELGADKKKLIALLGTTMYQSNIAEVVLKELLQNSFDATKSAEAAGQISKGKIDINIDSKERTINFVDNGIGMTSDTVQKAFFTIGGSHKPGVSNELKSGGLGLAKMAFIFGSDWIALDTVHNGIRTSMKATSQEIQNDNFKINTTPTDKPNGTSVTIKIPAKYVNSNGDEKNIDFPYESSYSYGFLGKPLIGNVEVSYKYNRDTKKLSLGNLPEGYKKFTTASTSWGTMDIYINLDNISSTKKSGVHRILSSGLFQFSERIKKMGVYEDLPLDIIVDIKPKVDTTHEQYPFNNQRENFRRTVEDDIGQLHYYLQSFYRSIEREMLSRSFAGLKGIEPVDIITPDQEALKANKRILESTRSKETLEEIINTRLKEIQEQDKSVSISDQGITTGKGTTTKKQQSEEARSEEKKYQGSFKAERKIEGGPDKLEGAADPSKPIIHNNTNLKFKDSDIDYISKVATIMIKYKDSILKHYGENYYDNLKDQMWGISIDKTYGGVNVRPDLLNFMGINPFYVFPLDKRYTNTDLVNYIAIALDHLIIHEFNHNFQRNEGAGFTGQFITTYSDIHSLPDHFELITSLKQVIRDNLKTIKLLHDEYHSEHTTNAESSFEANKLGPDNIKGRTPRNEGIPEDDTQANEGAKRNDPEGNPIPGEAGEIILANQREGSLTHFKKTVKFNKKDVSFLNKNMILKRIKPYNQKYGTHYYIPYKQVGQADIWRAGEITNTAPGYNPNQTTMFYRELPNTQTQKNLIALDTLRELITSLKRRFPTLRVLELTSDEAKLITQETANPWNGEPVFFYQGNIYIVGDHVTSNMILHEFAHPIFRSMWNSESKTTIDLFHKLYDDLAATSEGAGIIAEVTSTYPELVPGTEYFKEEVLVRALATRADNLRNEIKDSPGFLGIVKRILYAIKQFLRRLFTQPISPEDLDVNTTLDQLADMLINDEFTIDRTLVSQEDMVAFMRKNNEFLNELSEAKILEKIQPLLKQLYDTTYRDEVRLLEKLPELLNLVQGKFEENLLQNMRRNIRDYKDLITTSVDELNSQAKSFFGALYQLDTITEKISEEMDKIRKAPRHKEDVPRVNAMVEFVNYFDKFLNDASTGAYTVLSHSLAKSQNHELLDLMAKITRQINNVKHHADPIVKEGIEALLTDVMGSMDEKIDERFKAHIDQLKKSGVKPSIIKDVENKYKELKGSPGKIKAMMSGLKGDAGPLNSMLEGWMYAADDVVGGMATFFKNTFNSIQTALQFRFNDFVKQVVPLAKEAGITIGTSVREFSKNFLTVDSKPIWIDGELKEQKVLTFINKHKDYRWKVAELNDKIRKAEEAFELSGDPKDELILNGLRSDKDIQDQYFWQQYTPEFYEKDIIFKSPVGQIAKAKRDKIYQEINELRDTAEKEGDLFDIRPGDVTSPAFQIEQKFKELKQLASLRDLNGDLKVNGEANEDKHLEIAEILQTSQSVNRDYYDYKLVKGLFQDLLLRYEQEMVDSGLTPDSKEFLEKRQQWLDHNTVQATTQEYRDITGELFDQLKQIYASISNPPQIVLDLLDARKELNDTLSGYRDSDGQPIGTDMSPKTIEKIKSLQEKVIALDKQIKNTLTSDEARTLEQFEMTLNSGRELTDKQKAYYDILSSKIPGTEGLDKWKRADAAKIWRQLGELQTKEPTEYYLDIFNNFMEKLPDELKEQIIDLNKTADIDRNSADYIINLPSAMLKDMLESVPGFKGWFKSNHIQRSVWDPAIKKNRKVWQRIASWSVTRPLDPNYMERTSVYDLEGNVTSIQGKPSQRFYKRVVKSVFETPRIAGLTVAPQDMDNPYFKGLPKSKAEGAPNDDFINPEYLRLQREEPARFKALEKIKELYLDAQKDADYYARLGYDFARIRMRTSEKIASGQNPLDTYWNNIRDFFRRVPDDFDSGYNHDDQVLLTTEAYFDEKKVIPIVGISNLPLENVSMDLFHGVAQYFGGLERQKQLKKILPFFKATHNVLTDPANSIRTAEGVIKKNMFGRSNERASALKNKMDREFFGQTNTGLFANNKGVNAIVNAAFKGASLSYLAWQIPSAIANMSVQIIQNVIRSVSGQEFTFAELGRGSIFAGKASTAIASEIHRSGTHSLIVQLCEIFDSVPGRFSQTVGTSQGRSWVRDFASFSWLYSPRKFMENYATIQAFGAMMDHVRVKQVLNGKTTEIKYQDAWYLKDGQITLKEGIDLTYAQGGKEFNKILNYMQHVQHDMNGAYDGFSQPEAARYILYRMYSFLRKYVTTMLTNRFAPTRRSPGMMDIRTGFYTETAIALWRIIQDPKYIKNLSDQEKASARQFVAETGLVMLMWFMYGLFGWDPDDEDKYEKLRAKSGPLPLPFVPETENAFQVDGWLSNHMLLQLLKAKSQTEMWIPLPGLGLKDYTSIPSITPIAVGPTLDLGAKIFDNILRLSAGDERAYYQRTIGPYSWQQEGDPKLFNYLGQLGGLRGATVTPELAIQKQEQAKVLK